MMPAIRRNHLTGYAVLALSVFLCFCLIFEPYLVVPEWLMWVGRWHPLLLHFPIVLLLLVIFLGFSRKGIPTVLFQLAVITALLTAITGFLLSRETGVKGSLLWWHQYLGSGVALLAAIWYAFYTEISKLAYAQPILQIALLSLVVSASHFGALTTHGEHFLDLPDGQAAWEIPENPLIYEHVVHRILDEHCIKCHNPNKRKGELLMTDMAGLLKGGESGSAMVPGSPGESEIIRRLHLPAAHEEHMPPEGERPVEKGMIQIIERWIALGSPDTTRMNDLQIDEPLLGLIKELQHPGREEKWAELPKVHDSTLLKFENDYITIRRILQRSEALSVNVYLPPAYDSTMVTSLRGIAANIVELDISGLPIGRTEMDAVGSCPNIEWLELDRTTIADSDITPLANLANLEVLKIYDTDLGDASLQTFVGLTNLRHVYLQGTRFSPRALERWREQHPGLSIYAGEEASRFVEGVQSDSLAEAL